jgi:hypothetical protein
MKEAVIKLRLISYQAGPVVIKRQFHRVPRFDYSDGAGSKLGLLLSFI